MVLSQDYNQDKMFFKLNAGQRLICLLVFVLILSCFLALNLAGRGEIDLKFWLGVCGFKLRTGMPCPTCGYTSSAILFSRGEILNSIYTQPAAGLMCIILAFMAILSFLGAVFGVYFNFIYKFWKTLKLRFIFLFMGIVIFLGWLVTLSRAFLNR